MGLKRSSVRRALTGLATAGLLAGTLLTAPTAAQAAPADSTAQLLAATAELDATARVPGTAWVVDAATGQVEVTVDESVTGAKLQHIIGVTAKHGNAVRVVRTPGTLTTFAVGGDAIFTGGARCSLGFNVRNSAGQRFLLTAGHCTNIGSTWRTSTQTIGPRAGSSFPGNDYGIVRYTNAAVSSPSRVGSQVITRLATPTVGQTVTRRGSTTGTRSGRVTGLNATVNYQQGGTVTGLIRTTVCAQRGDSGGPLYSGSTGFGITSGGSGNCTTGGITYFQPVVEAANRYGVGI